MIGPGDKVVCIHNFIPQGDEFLPVRGEIYTVRDFDGPEFIWLHEITNQPRDYSDGFGEASFWIKRFRKLDISQFRDMAKKADTLPVTERKEMTV